MKVRIEICGACDEEEVVIRCRQVDETVQKVQRYVLEQSAAPQLTFYKDGEAFFFPLGDVMFFETGGESVFAHTHTEAYRVKRRLYELEVELPRGFVRVSKSTILNTKHVYSIARNLSGASPVQFYKSHKVVYCSRMYYRDLKTRLDERSLL